MPTSSSSALSCQITASATIRRSSPHASSEVGGPGSSSQATDSTRTSAAAPSGGPWERARRRQSTPPILAPAEALPRVAERLQTRRDRRQRVAVRAQLPILELLPAQRRGDRRARLGTHCVGRHGGLRVGVAGGVDEDAALALVLAPLGGQPVGMARGELLGDLARLLAHDVVDLGAPQRSDDVDAARATRHRVWLAAEL